MYKMSDTILTHKHICTQVYNTHTRVHTSMYKHQYNAVHVQQSNNIIAVTSIRRIHVVNQYRHTYHSIHMYTQIYICRTNKLNICNNMYDQNVHIYVHTIQKKLQVFKL